MSKLLTAVLVGAGYRGDIYASYSIKYPDKLKIVGIVENNSERLNLMKKKYNVADDNCFDSVDEFVLKDKFADVVINATMDQFHVVTSIPILKKGYDLLLEKPFALNEKEMRDILRVVRKYNRKVYVCHVLRYSPFYLAIKKCLLNNDIGDIINIQLAEHVTYHHMAVSYVRGQWRSEKICFAPMLLAKCCHDVDLMMWLMGDNKAVSVSSFGGDFQFLPEKKPEGAGTRCMVDCKYNKECPFSAESNYIFGNWRTQYVWRDLDPDEEPTEENKIKSLKTTNPFGKCVWDFERDGNVDHQAIMVNFENGALGTLNMVGGTSRSERKIHIIGTKGEIKGVFEDSQFVVRKISPYSPDGYVQSIKNVGEYNDCCAVKGGHRDADEWLVADFVDSINGKEPSISCTDIFNSVPSHAVIFKADKSLKYGRVEKITY